MPPPASRRPSAPPRLRSDVSRGRPDDTSRLPYLRAREHQRLAPSGRRRRVRPRSTGCGPPSATPGNARGSPPTSASGSRRWSARSGVQARERDPAEGKRLRARPPLPVMYAFIDAHRADYGAEPICRVLQIVPYGYYEHRAHQTDRLAALPGCSPRHACARTSAACGRRTAASTARGRCGGSSGARAVWS